MDVTNGITLCKSCHTNFHVKYGQGDNTKEQFEEWMGNISVQLEQYEGDLPVARQVYDYTEDKIYESAMLWGEVHKSNISYIYNCCNHSEIPRKIKKKDGTTTVQITHNNTVKGHFLFWYDEYKNMTDEDLKIFFNTHRNPTFVSVICITTGERFDTIMSASKFYQIERKTISDCCKGKREFCTTKDKSKKLQWMYLSEFEQLSKDKQTKLLNDKAV